MSTENIIDGQNEDFHKRPRAPTPILPLEYEDPDVLEMSQEDSVVPSCGNEAMISMQEGRSPHLCESRSETDLSESSASPAQLHSERNITVSKHARATSQEVSKDIEPDTLSLTDKESFELPGNQGQPVLITSFDDVEPKYLNSNRSEYSNIPPPLPGQRNDSGAYVSPLTLQSFSRSVPERNSTPGNTTDEHGYLVCFL